jgi:hypothetical protein
MRRNELAVVKLRTLYRDLPFDEWCELADTLEWQTSLDLFVFVTPNFMRHHVQMSMWLEGCKANSTEAMYKEWLEYRLKTENEESVFRELLLPLPSLALWLLGAPSQPPSNQKHRHDSAKP